MTKLEPETISYINKIVNNHVPDINHPLLHVNVRKQMQKSIVELVEQEKIKPTLLTLTALAKNWDDVLHLRAITRN